MAVVTTHQVIRFTVEAPVEFDVQVSHDLKSGKTRYYIKAPDEVRFERVKDSKPMKAPT